MQVERKSIDFLTTRGFAALLVLGTALVLLSLPRPIVEFGFVGGAALLAGAAVLVAVMVHPLVPFALYFSVLFFADTRLPGIGISANQPLAVLFFLSFASWKLRGRALRLESRLLPLLAGVAAYFAASALLGQDWERGLDHGRSVAIYLLMAVCVAGTLTTERGVLALAWVVVLLTFGSALLGLAEVLEKGILTGFTGRFAGANRITGGAKNSIVFGWNLVFALPFVFLLFSQLRTPLLRVLALVPGLLILLVALMTFNRQTLIFIVAVAGLAVVLFRYRNRSVVLAFAVAAGVLVGVTILPLLVQRFLSVRDISTDISYLERRDTFLVGKEMLRARPLFGVGLGSYPAVWGEYVPPDYPTFAIQYQERSRLRFPDFGYWQIVCETGVVGLGLYLLLMGTVLRRAWVVRRTALVRGDPFAANVAALVLTLTAFSLLSAFIQDNFLYVRNWVLLGLALLMDERILLPEPEVTAPADSDPDAEPAAS